jgi:hypothetical protein
MPYGYHVPTDWERYIRHAVANGECIVSRRLALRFDSKISVLILYDRKLCSDLNFERSAILIAAKRKDHWNLISAHPRSQGDVFACNHCAKILGIAQRWLTHQGGVWQLVS